jgi:hypothetical protein
LVRERVSFLYLLNLSVLLLKCSFSTFLFVEEIAYAKIIRCLCVATDQIDSNLWIALEEILRMTKDEDVFRCDFIYFNFSFILFHGLMLLFVN